MLCERIRDQAEASSLSGRELARAANVSTRTVWSIMNLKARPSGRTIFRLCRALGTTPRDLLAGRPPRQFSVVCEPAATYGLPPSATILKRKGEPDPLPTPPDVLEAMGVIARRLGVDEIAVVESVAKLWREKSEPKKNE